MITTLTQLATSTEPVQFRLSATQNGQAYNPTGDPVAVTFIPSTGLLPASTALAAATWYPASWQTDPGPVYWASILVGPLNGGVPLAAGPYVAYVKVTDNPAVPEKPGAYLIIT